MVKFKAVLDEPDLLKDSISAVSNLLNEGVFKLSKNGIELSAMDPANVAMVELKLLSSAFRSFEVEKDFEISVNITDLTSVLRRAKATDSIAVELKDNVLNLEFSGDLRRSFDIPLLDLKQESKTPNLEFPAEVEMKSAVIEESISDAEIVSDVIVLEADPDSFVIRAEGEGRKARLELEKDSASIINLKAKDHVKSTFPIDYLRKMAKAAKLSETAVLQIGNDYPMRLDFKVLNKLQLGFVLAPRIESQ